MDNLFNETKYDNMFKGDTVQATSGNMQPEFVLRPTGLTSSISLHICLIYMLSMKWIMIWRVPLSYKAVVSASKAARFRALSTFSLVP